MVSALGRLEGRPIVPRLVTLAVAALCIAAAAVYILDAHTGLDLTDEGFYLLAADNHQPASAYNGWFGAYTGLVFAAVGHDIALFRIVAMLVLVGCGALLAAGVLSVCRAEGIAPSRSASLAIVLGIAAGQLAFYGLYLRSPGYNWLALTGTLLAVSGLLRMIATPREASRSDVLVMGVLVGAGCILAFWAKISDGIGLVMLAFIVAAMPAGSNRHARRTGGVVAVVAATILLAFHSIFIADPATTVAVIRRALGFIALQNPQYYDPLSAVRQAAVDLARAPWRVIVSTAGIVLLSVAPLILLARRGRSAPLTTVILAMVAIGGVLMVTIAQGRWIGGTDAAHRLGLAVFAVLLSAALAALTASLVARRRWDEEAPQIWRLVSASGVLAVAAFLYAFGSANGIVPQLNGAGGLVLASAALLAVVCVPRRWASRVLVGSSVTIATLALLLIATARMDPYRTGPADKASATVDLGQRHARLDVDPMAAAFWETLQADASDNGWQPGMKLVDMTWSPAIPYALGATVPVTQLANMGVQQNATAIEALRLSGGPAWRDAWVLVPAEASPSFPGLSPPDVLATIGRRFPSDYRLVSRLTVPWRDLPIQLWAPATP